MSDGGGGHGGRGGDGGDGGDGEDLYAVLGVARTATTHEIRAAFRRKSLELHPDQGGDATGFARVVDAYGVLKDEALRSRYDVELADGRGFSSAAAATSSSWSSSSWSGDGPNPEYAHYYRQYSNDYARQQAWRSMYGRGASGKPGGFSWNSGKASSSSSTSGKPRPGAAKPPPREFVRFNADEWERSRGFAESVSASSSFGNAAAPGAASSEDVFRTWERNAQRSYLNRHQSYFDRRNKRLGGSSSSSSSSSSRGMCSFPRARALRASAPLKLAPPPTSSSDVPFLVMRGLGLGLGLGLTVRRLPLGP